MSIHIGAWENEFAETVLLPGDPLRAKYIAETFLENAKCYNEIRNMFDHIKGHIKGKEFLSKKRVWWFRPLPFI